MTVKNTYWLIGPDNTFAQVEGAARRDELAERGWTATEEPVGPERVWMQHDTLQTFSLFPAVTVEAWQARGWQPAAPPTQRTDSGWLVVLPNPGEQAQPVAAATAVVAQPDIPIVTTPTADGPQASNKEDKSRGR